MSDMEVLRRRGGGSGAEGTHAWIRWAVVWDALFYLMLIVALVSSLVATGFYGREALALVVLTVLFGIWYWFMIVWHRRWIQEDRPMLVYAAVAIALCVALIWINPAYHVLLFVAYSQIYSFLTMRWAVPLSVILTLLLVVRGAVVAPEAIAAWIFVGALSTLFGVLFAAWINSIITQSEERQRLIEDLEATRSQLAAQERRAGILEERGRLAREIHDTIAQGFTSIVAHLEASEAALPPGSDTSLRHLDLARNTARDNLVEARHLVAALRPELLAGSSLPEALQRLTDRWSRETGVGASLAVTGERRELPQECQVALLRAAQEALSNARKHATARNVTATLSYMDDAVALDVQDDGAGFDGDRIATDANGGFGLRAMRERVEELGGRLIVEAEPGEGATLVVEIPVGTSKPDNPAAAT